MTKLSEVFPEAYQVTMAIVAGSDFEGAIRAVKRVAVEGNAEAGYLAELGEMAERVHGELNSLKEIQLRGKVAIARHKRGRAP